MNSINYHPIYHKNYFFYFNVISYVGWLITVCERKLCKLLVYKILRNEICIYLPSALLYFKLNFQYLIKFCKDQFCKSKWSEKDFPAENKSFSEFFLLYWLFVNMISSLISSIWEKTVGSKCFTSNIVDHSYKYRVDIILLIIHCLVTELPQCSLRRFF